MILALVQQLFIAFVLYNIYSAIPFYKEKYTDEVNRHENPQQLNNNKSLAIVDELNWTLEREYLVDIIIDGRFKVGENLGSSGYIGFVQSGIDLQTGEEVAIKFSKKRTIDTLEEEFWNYLYLGADDPDVVQHGIPHIIHFGDFGGYEVLVMTKAGPSLFELLYSTRRGKFSISTVCKIAKQAIRIFEYIHSKGLVFHDVKPQNMAIGNIDKNKIIFFDFGFSQFYVNALGEAMEREDAIDIFGTPEYMARGPLNAKTWVRKDDLISLGLVLLRLNGIYLPWMKKTENIDSLLERMDIVLDTWAEYTIEEICKESDNPKLFLDYFYYLDDVEPQEKPDYDYLVEFFAKELTADELGNEDLGIFNEEDMIIDGRYNITEQLHLEEDEFVRYGDDMETGRTVCIIFSRKARHIRAENEYLNLLNLEADDPEIINHGILYALHFGYFENFRVLVTTAYNSTLDELLKETEANKFAMDTVCKIAMQTIRILEYIHSKGMVLQNVRPKNMAISATDSNRIFFIDFSSCEFYLDSLGEQRNHTDMYLPDKNRDHVVRKYLNHDYFDRKNDLLLLGIILLEFNGVSIPSKEEVEQDSDWDEYGLDELCYQTDDPDLFIAYFDYFYYLESSDNLNYDGLVELFTKNLTSEQLENNDLGISLA